MFVMADGSRTFSIEDISEDDYLILHSLELEKMPLTLRALIADILWTNKTEEKALESLERVTAKWSEKYPNYMKSCKQNWDAISPIFEATKKWTLPLRTWGQVYGKLSIMYEGRLLE